MIIAFLVFLNFLQAQFFETTTTTTTFSLRSSHTARTINFKIVKDPNRLTFCGRKDPNMMMAWGNDGKQPAISKDTDPW